MKTLKDLFDHLKNNNISFFSSKKPGVICITGKHKKLLRKVSEIDEKGYEIWDSFYNNRWTTFIKNPEKSITKSNYQNNKYRNNDYDENYDDHVELCEEFSYDEICCDPDLQEHWENRYGPGDPIF